MGSKCGLDWTRPWVGPSREASLFRLSSLNRQPTQCLLQTYYFLLCCTIKSAGLKIGSRAFDISTSKNKYYLQIVLVLNYQTRLADYWPLLLLMWTRLLNAYYGRIGKGKKKYRVETHKSKCGKMRKNQLSTGGTYVRFETSRVRI